MKRKILFTALSVFVIFLIFCGLKFHNNPAGAGDYKIITDMDDRMIKVPADPGETRIVIAPDGSRIEIPSYPQRIACFYNPAYDKIIMLSSGSRIVLMPKETTPWARKFYPELAEIPVNTAGGVPDVERLLKLKVDMVIYPKGRCNISKVTEAGIAAICPFNDKFIPSSMDEYTAEFKRQIMFFSEILGRETIPRAERYCKYLEDITSRIRAITSKIPESQKPRVYYGRMNDLCSTQGNNTIMKWYTGLAGGIYLPEELDNYFATVSMEQIISWDPDIILLGMYGSFDAAPLPPGLKMLEVHKKRKIFRIPAGVFCWDMTSCETALLPLFLGKKFHPDLFKNWDMAEEMTNFYSEIYGIRITGKDAERILAGMPPL